jgi:outer membrane protein TolC
VVDVLTNKEVHRAIALGHVSRVAASHEALRAQVAALTAERDRARDVLRRVLDAPTAYEIPGDIPVDPVREQLDDALRAEAEREVGR